MQYTKLSEADIVCIIKCLAKAVPLKQQQTSVKLILAPYNVYWKERANVPPISIVCNLRTLTSPSKLYRWMNYTATIVKRKRNTEVVIATIALHRRTQFSAVTSFILASQRLPRTPTARFGQGFPKKVYAAQPHL
jgi:hypothetical protein